MAALQATAREVNSITVVDLSGRITLGEGSALLRTTIKTILANGQNRIVLNLADVTYIDSSGIGELLSGFTSTKSQGGELKLMNLTKKIRDMLQITKLYTVFDIHSDEESAVRSFV